MQSHRGTQDIRTERLLLRRYHAGDTADIWRNYATDEQVTRFLSWRPYTDIAVLQRFIDAQISAYSDDTVYSWVIEQEGQVIGSLSVTHSDEVNGSCEVGYCLGRAFWGQGIATEAMLGLLRFLFDEVGYRRICAKHDAENPASGRVMVKCGMRQEGRLRKYYLRHDGTTSDALLYALLSDEFGRRV